MDLNTVFTKTSKGAMEVTGKSRELSREQSRVLNLVDGKSNVGEILDRAGRMSENKLQEVLSRLASDGFIRVLRGNQHTQLAEDFGFSSTIIVDEANTQAFFEAQAALERNTEERAAQAKAQKESEREALLAELKAEKQAEEAKAKAALESKSQAKAQAADQARRKSDAERKAKEEAERRARLEAEINAAAEAERKAREQAERRAAAEAKAREQAEAKARLEEQARENARKEAEAKAKAATEARARVEAEARMREAEAARRKAEEESQVLARQLQEAKLAAELDARVKRRLEARAKEEEDARRRVEAEAQAKLEEEARRRKEAEAKAEAEAEARAKAEEEARQRAEAERQARAKAEVETKAREEAEARARAEEEARKRAEAEARAKAEAEAKAREEAEQKARKEAETRAEEEARRAAERRAREEAEAGAKAEAEAKARAEAERKAREEAEARARAEEEARKRAEEEARQAAERQARAEAEARAKAEAETKARAEAERKAREEAEAQARAEEEARKQEEENARKRAEEEAQRAAQAAAEAERKAREEAEMRARAEEEARKRAEQEGRLTAEREAREEAERKTRELAEQRQRAEAEARAREEERVRAKAEAEAHARAEAAEARRIAEEQERFLMEEEARERDEADVRAQALAEAKTNEQAALEKILGGGRRGRAIDFRKWVKSAGVGMAVLLGLSLLLINFMSFNFYAPQLEAQLAKTLGEPAQIGGLRFSVFPLPHWRVEQLTLGRLHDVKIGSAELEPALGDWFADVKNLRRASFENVVVDGEALTRLGGWLEGQRQAPFRAETIEFRQVKAEVRGFDLPAFNARVDLQGNTLRKALLTSVDNRATLEVVPASGGTTLHLLAQHWTPPLGMATVFDKLDIQGVVKGPGIEVGSLFGEVFGGSVKGSGRMTWDDGFKTVVELEIKRVNVEAAMPVFTKEIRAEGTLEAKAHVVLESANLENLLATPHVRATFLVHDGALGNVDLVRAINAPARTVVSGGQTKFNSFSGYLQIAKGSYQYRQLRLTLGMLSATGAVDITPDKTLSGTAASELRSKATAIRVPLTISGTLATPTLKGSGAASPVRPRKPDAEVEQGA